MTSLYFGMLREGVPADEKVVRSTAEPYEHDAPAAVQDSMPDQQEVSTDPNPDLGMVGRQLGSHWVEGVKNAPEWRERVDSAHLHNDVIDRQVSTSGTAAGREAAGIWGHPSASYAVGIAPQGDLTDGGKMGNEYFVRNEREIQDTSDNTMMTVPPAYDQSTKGRVAAEGKVASRESAMAAMYDAFWNEGN